MKLQEFVGKRIAELRKQKNQSQQDLANEANIERSRLTVIESGNANISISTLERIIEALGENIHSFFKQNDKKDSGNNSTPSS